MIKKINRIHFLLSMNTLSKFCYCFPVVRPSGKGCMCYDTILGG